MPFLGTDSHALTLPVIVLTAGDIGGSLTVPAVTLEARDADGYAEFTLPAVTLSSSSLTGESGILDKSLPKIVLTAEVLVGEIGDLSRSLPKIQLSASGELAASGSLIVPAVTLSATGSPEISWDAAITVPLVQLAGIVITNADLITGDDSDYAVWVMNQLTGAHSTYTNWQVNSYGKFDGKEIILLPTGIYELTGTDDASVDIDTNVEWVTTDLGSHKQKRVDSVAVNMRSLEQQEFVLTATVDEQLQRAYPKNVASHPEGMRRHRVLLPKGLNGQNWTIGHKNKDGGDFVLDDIEVIPVELTRKFK